MPPWVASLALHLLILLVLANVAAIGGHRLKQLTVNTKLSEMDRNQEFIRLVDVSSVNSPDVTSLHSSATPVSTDLSSVSDQVHFHQIEERIPDPDFRPVTMLPMPTGEQLSTEVRLSGKSGVNVAGAGAAIDRITYEILHSLERKKTLVIWILDSSLSLLAERELIARRFDRVYEELGLRGNSENDALLTAVIAFGEKTNLLTEKPVSDVSALQKVVRSMPEDKSGKEHVFAAISEATSLWGEYSTSGRRNVMMVVITDEAGDDDLNMDLSLAGVRRQRIPVFVLGPVAPFGRKQIHVKWTDEPTGEVFNIPVERGPETIQTEHIALPRWYKNAAADLLSSGFGPYALSRLATKSGGIYFLRDDKTIPGPRFETSEMLEYVPDYVSRRAFQQTIAQDPFRRAILRTVDESNELKVELPPEFLAWGIQFAIRDAKKKLVKMVTFLDGAVRELGKVKQYRGQERSRRWRAQYDLSMGRLLATKARCESYGQLLEEMYQKPKVPKDETKNAFRLVGRRDLTPESDDSKTEEQRELGSNPQNSGRNDVVGTPRTDAEWAHSYLTRVAEEHPGTPWAVIAKNEMDMPLSFEWEEVLIAPPKDIKLPWDSIPWDQLPKEVKVAKARFEKQKLELEKRRKKPGDKREDAKKRLPKL